MLTLRPYQAECLGAVDEAKVAGVMSQLVVLPTAAGKTVVFSALAKTMDAKTLVLVERDVLVRQTVDKFHIVWPEASVGVVKAEQDEMGYQVTVASVQTLSRPNRLRRLPLGYDLVITDEAHHAVAESYGRIYDRVGAGKTCLHVGVTATPNRSDRKGLGAVFERVTYIKPLTDMIQEGWLARPTGVTIRTKTNISSVRSRGGDFNEAELESVVNTANRNELIATAMLQQAQDRKSIVFAAGVKHAYALAKILSESGIRAEALDGETPQYRREDMFRRFRTGELRAVVNFGVLTEGFDEPSVDAIVLARPTQSQSLYIQMVGRGLRLHPGKRDCLVLDVADSSERHPLVQLPTLLGRAIRDEEEAARKRGSAAATPGLPESPADESSKQLSLGHDLVAQQVELISRYVWQSFGDGWLLPLADEALRLVPAGNGMWRCFRVDKTGKMEALHPEPLQLDWAQGIAENVARGSGSSALIKKNARWQKDLATDAQIKLLQKLHLPVPDGVTKGEAKRLIDERLWSMKMPSQNQVAFLQHLGVPVPDGLTREHAKKLIDEALQAKRSGRVMAGGGR